MNNFLFWAIYQTGIPVTALLKFLAFTSPLTGVLVLAMHYSLVEAGEYESRQNEFEGAIVIHVLMLIGLIRQRGAFIDFLTAD